MEPQHIKANVQVIAASVIYGFSGIFFMYVKNMAAGACCFLPASFRASCTCRLSGSYRKAVRNQAPGKEKIPDAAWGLAGRRNALLLYGCELYKCLNIRTFALYGSILRFAARPCPPERKT